MRSQEHTLHQIQDFLESEDKIRVAMLNGSRVNPNVTKDIFCDYDVATATTDPASFVQHPGWIAQFGELVILQQNEWETSAGGTGYIFLMQFTDGVRIDLSFHPMDALPDLLEDSLKVLLVDKDHIIPPLAPPDDSFYMPQKPTQKEFDELTNEFWWCATNLAKGLWRDELTYVKGMQNIVIDECLVKMLGWYVARDNWTVNVGKFGKWLEKHLPPDLWQKVENSYAGSDENAMWEALFEAGALFRILGLEVADSLGYTYPLEDDLRTTEYLKRVRALPKDAKDF